MALKNLSSFASCFSRSEFQDVGYHDIHDIHVLFVVLLSRYILVGFQEVVFQTCLQTARLLVGKKPDESLMLKRVSFKALERVLQARWRVLISRKTSFAPLFRHFGTIWRIHGIFNS